MQNPNEDTEWNDVLRAKGIIPPKEKEISEETIISMIEDTIRQKDEAKVREMESKTLDELDELEDSEDEAVLLEYRRKRIAEMRKLAAKPRFGSVQEISGQDYVQEVNNAGKDIWVVIHLFKQGIPLCALLNQHLHQLATKFPHTKFLKSVAQTCIPNYPEKNLPSVFVYFEGELKQQIIGPLELRGPSISLEELEFMLGQAGAIETEIKSDPKKPIKDKLFSDLQESMDW